MRRFRPVWAAVAAAAAAAALVLGFGIFGRPSGGAGLDQAGGGQPGTIEPASARGLRPGTSVPALQARLRSLPGDWTAWAALGSAYVEQARLTSDPTYYPKADGALARSLQIRPGNDLALTGQAMLANARHDFGGALPLAVAALAANPFSSTAQGARGDALTELGRYDDAAAAFQAMVDLKPGLASFARVSYLSELRGDVAAARTAMQRALTDAATPADAAFALYNLGELDRTHGHLDAARQEFSAGLARAPSYLPLVAGQARVSAESGDVNGALADYANLVVRLPQPAYLIEYGELLESLGRREEARRQYDLVRTEEQLFASSGVNVDLEMALFEADHGDPKAALAAASAELARRDSVFVDDAMCWALHAVGRDREALAHCARAARLGTPNATFHYHRAVVEAAVGEPAGAAADLRAALALNKDFSPLFAPRARALLSQLEARR